MTIKQIKDDPEELKRCMEDPVYFAEKYVKFNGIEPLRLRDAQKQQIRMFVNNANGTVIVMDARYGKRVVANAVKQYLEWRASLL